jgi:hypothetical protein
VVSDFEGRALQMFLNKMYKKMFSLKRDELFEQFQMLRNEELCYVMLSVQLWVCDGLDMWLE